MNEDKTPNFLSIFSGAGGLDHGFVRAGFKIIGSAEKVSDRVKTHNFNLNVNYPSVDLENEDEYNAFINRYKERQIDLLVSGFPCQGYTVAGLRNPNDPLNQLYKIIIKTLKHLNIKNFMLENVPSILNMEKGEAIKKIEAEFNDAGYFFWYAELNSVNFSVPQKRKRIIFIGTNDQKEIPKIQMLLIQLQNYKSPYIRTVKDAIGDLENAPENEKLGHIYRKHSNQIIENMKKVVPGGKLYKKHNTNCRRLYYDQPSWTVFRAFFIHPTQPRFLTMREKARLQGFNDDFIFYGPNEEQRAQVAFAVPTPMAKIIAEHIKWFLL